MANTYYDSQLTAAEIEAALEAIDGVIVPANNGKVLAINNGKIEARSVQWGGGSSVVQPLSVTQNGTYNPPSGVDGYAPVTVDVSGGGSEPPTMEAKVSNNTFISDGITVNSQPVITDGEIAASDSQGLTFSWNCNRLVFEFDMNLSGNGGGTVLSFGGSNTNNGILVIDTATFMLYANTIRFSESISLTLGETYHTKIELTPGTAKIYIDGSLAATGLSSYVNNIISYVKGGNQIGVLYNQSYHPEYNKNRINNLKIYM